MNHRPTVEQLQALIANWRDSGRVQEAVNDCADQLERLMQSPAPDDPAVTVYACGYENSPGSFGMWAGPHPDLKAMLDMVPEDNGRRAVLFQFAPDPDNPGEQISTELYVYSHRRNRWMAM